VSKGPNYGYFVNASKTILVVKNNVEDRARSTFNGTGVKIETARARALGAAIGSPDFVAAFVAYRVWSFCEEIHKLAHIAESSPQAALSGFVHGMRHRWRFLQRTMPNIQEACATLEASIRQIYIPALL
jgi:hypothetical protein